MFLYSAIRDQSSELKEGTTLTHLSWDKYKYDCEKCHDGECGQCAKYREDQQKLYKQLAKKLREGYQSTRGMINPPEDPRRITPKQKARFSKREAAAGWTKPKKSKFQEEEEEEKKRRMRNPKAVEEEEEAMKAQYKKMQDRLKRGRSPETKEVEPEQRIRKREREPSLAPSASGVMRRKLDTDALEAAVNAMTDDEVMKLATKFSVAGITEKGVGVNLLFDTAYANLGSTPKQRVFSVCKAAEISADSVKSMAEIKTRSSAVEAFKAASSKEHEKEEEKRKDATKEEISDDESSQSARECFDVIKKTDDKPDWGDEPEDENVELSEDLQERRTLKSQAMDPRKSTKKPRVEDERKHPEENEGPTRGRKSELESSSDNDNREDRERSERGASKPHVILREKKEDKRDRSRSPVVLKSSQGRDVWYKTKGSSKGGKQWMKKVDRDEVHKSFLKFCKDKEDMMMNLKRNKSSWETLVISGQQMSCKVTVKIRPRHTRVEVPNTLQHWKKWSFAFSEGDKDWQLEEEGENVTNELMFEDETPPDYVVIFTLDPQAVKESHVFMAASTSTMSAISRGLFEDGAMRVEKRDRLMTACLTNDTSDGQYESELLQGLEEHVVKRKQEEGLSKKGLTGLSKVGLVLFLGSMFSFQPVDALIPEGLDVQHVAGMDNLPKFEKWHFAKFHPMSVVICSTGSEQLLNEVAHTLELKGGNTAYIIPQWGWDHDICVLKLYDTPVWHGPGDITLYGDDNESLGMFKDWASRKVRFKTPMTWEDAGNDPGFMKALEQLKMEANVAAAFPAEAEEEELEGVVPLDLPEAGGEDEPPIAREEGEEGRPRTMEEMESIFEQEEEMLESIPLPNMPKDEKERREAWLKLPRKARLAVRKLHRQFGHCPPRTLVEILRASGAKPEYVQAARTMRCGGCDTHRPKAQTSKSALPRSYEFNVSLGIDIFEVKDSNLQRYSVSESRMPGDDIPTGNPRARRWRTTAVLTVLRTV